MLFQNILLINGMAIHFKLTGVFEDPFLCNIPKTSAFAALLATGKPIFTIGIMYKEKTTFQIFFDILLLIQTTINFSPPSRKKKTLDIAKFTLRVDQ